MGEQISYKFYGPHLTWRQTIKIYYFSIIESISKRVLYITS